MQRRLVKRVVAGMALAAAASAERPARAEQPSPEAGTEVEPVPRSGLWGGVRAGIYLPYGTLYSDESLVTTPFQDLATTGPSIELDIGARFASHFMAYALFEHAFLGRGNSPAWTIPHGGQSAASTQALGIGLRWESNPSGFGAVADVAVAYRWFNVRWNDATTLRMHGPGDVRFGLGASWRIVRTVTLAPMLTASIGTFAYRTLDGQKLGESTGSYAALTITFLGHFDLD